MGRKLRLTYFSYSFFLMTFLSSITLILTIISPAIDNRLIVTSIIYIFLSITFLLILALLANHETVNLHLNKFLFVAITLIYGLAYVWSSLSYLFTNQIIRGQSLLFIYQIFPKTTVYIAVFVIFLVSMSLIFVSQKKFHFYRSSRKIERKSRVVMVISGFLLIGFIFIVPPLVNLFNPLVEAYNQGSTIYIPIEEVSGDKILDVQTGLENPNVIFILLESVSSEKIGAYGRERDVTPNIDFLADNGIVFENAYTTATHSDYAQPSYLTSRYMLSNGYRNFFLEKHERKNVWEVFSDKGYDTAYFSSQDDLWAGMNEYFNFESLGTYSYSLTDGETDYGSGLEKKDYDHKTTDKIILWLGDEERQESANPFFLYANFQGTHVPMSYPKEYAEYLPDNVLSIGAFRFNPLNTTLNRFDNSLRYVDLQIGRLLDELRRDGQLDNTVIILSSDHGHDFLKRHNLEGHGLSLYNEELLVPLIFYFPDIEPRRIKEPVSHIDVLPTVVDLLGFEIPKEFIGKPFEDKRRFFFYAQNHRYLLGMMKDNLKLIIDLNKKTVEVFDISNDPLEADNLVDKGIYDQEILELLLWNHCQENYFSKEKSDANLEEYCSDF